MNENKRFVYYEHKGADYILENPNTELDFIEMLGDCLEAEEIVDKLNDLADENEQLKSENDSYKNMFFEIVETALTDKNCRELYCKGLLDIFDKVNSLNQAREMIKEHLK